MLYNIDTEEGREAFTLHWLEVLSTHPVFTNRFTTVERAHGILRLIAGEEGRAKVEAKNPLTEEAKEAAYASLSYSDIGELHVGLSVLPGQETEAFALLIETDIRLSQHCEEVVKASTPKAPKKKRVKSAALLELATARKAYFKAESLAFKAEKKYRELQAQYEAQHPRKKRTE